MGLLTTSVNTSRRAFSGGAAPWDVCEPAAGSCKQLPALIE
eukprot:COSAG01_NODE_875_length_12972_cov_61.925503_2_plen_41_part_00